MNKNCEGCGLKQKDNSFECMLDRCEPFKNIINKCPCQKCLIKGMCGKTCKAFIEFLYKTLDEAAYERLDEISLRMTSQKLPDVLLRLPRERALLMGQEALTYSEGEVQLVLSRMKYSQLKPYSM